MNFSRTAQFIEKHIFAFILFSYFIVMAGIIYDMINEPPGIGQTVDKYGHVKPETIMRGRQNGQYVVEGLCASSFFVLIAGGMIMVEKAIAMTEADRKKPIFAVGGIITSTLGILMTYFFAKAKFGF